MRSKCLCLVLLITSVYTGVSGKNHSSRPKLRRNDFPQEFIFGSATSAYQCEGAAHEDGRGPSIWDTYSENFPEKILDGSNGSIADDSYNLYKEDVNMLHHIGFDAYRFSISWSRILPRGDIKGGINQAGIDYYNKLINQLLLKGVKPYVTLYHFDQPQALEDAYGGFLGAEIVNDFRDYAELCFREFGDRVKHWMTINEPLSIVYQGYVHGVMAPGRCSNFTKPDCTGGNGATEPYIVGHNLLLAHGAAVKVYREKYQANQRGEIGIALNTEWHYPYSESNADQLAAARMTAFTFDYFMEPLVSGKYPTEMVNHVKDGRLPTFTPEESAMIKGSYDFIGINYYASSYAKDAPCATENITIEADPCVSVVGERNGVPLGPKAGSDWLLIYPKGIRDLLLYAKLKFNNPVLYITENGVDEVNIGEIFLNDDLRIDYYAHHLKMCEGAAHEDGRGPSIWDTYAENFPEKILDGSNGHLADDSYNLYMEDVNLLHQIGFDAYRFSISWSRILPLGDLKGGINQAGIDYYNNLINQLLLKGVKPYVTLFHWDQPQALEDAYGGFLGADIVNDFQDYAELCFREFGDRVKHWITINEPLTVVQHGYLTGIKAPGRCSNFTRPDCTGGDGAIEPYIVGHNFLLAHGAAVKVYREKYLIVTAIFTPNILSTGYSESLDYFMEPLVNGKYPTEMVNHVKDGRLPTFTQEESSMLKGSYDFIGINYYTSSYAKDVPCATENITMATDPCVSVVVERNGVPIGPKAGSDWLLIYPKGIRDLLLYVKFKFNNPVLYITENGVDEASIGEIFLNDDLRIDYYAHHLKMVTDAIS
ncbi:hypothetical protein AALP_AA1G050600 [Arabis alpina]|uniref:beta-glucosidase n=1 Tax=Arabis alpina TaxID=50452 RepID=A0A087HL77_ARAAL|nr:hypothetical protein AALP_AA1G050600 [Arabis alpina]